MRIVAIDKGDAKALPIPGFPADAAKGPGPRDVTMRIFLGALVAGITQVFANRVAEAWLGVHIGSPGVWGFTADFGGLRIFTSLARCL